MRHKQLETAQSSSHIQQAGVIMFLLCIGVFVWFFASDTSTSQSFSSKSGLAMQDDFRSLKDRVAFSREANAYVIQDTLAVQDAHADENKNKSDSEDDDTNEVQAQRRTIRFPENYNDAVRINFGGANDVKMRDTHADAGYTQKILSENETSFFEKNTGNTQENSAIAYQSSDARKTLYYSYGTGDSGEKKLKNWVYYASGDGSEKESYAFENARLKKNDDGSVSIYQFALDTTEAQTQGVTASVLDRANRTFEEEAWKSVLSSEEDMIPQAIIPRPFYIDKNGDKTFVDWEIAGGNTSITVAIKVRNDQYPLALDPTLQFTVPGQNISSDTITGGSQLAKTADINADGRTDLVVAYNGSMRVYYNDGLYPTSNTGADVVITGASDNYGSSFGSFTGFALGTFDAGASIDFAVSAYDGVLNTSRFYIFYNDGTLPATADSADVTVSGIASTRTTALESGDFNFDGTIDIAVGVQSLIASQGKTYIFYNDGSYPTTLATADVIITGDISSTVFGSDLKAGDFNFDGRTDLAASDPGYNSYQGRVYIFYNDGSYPSAVATADVIITGAATNNSFGIALTSGDFNFDGRIDLATSATAISTNTGRVYMFYNDGSIPTTAATADVSILGESANGFFGNTIMSGDYNSDSRTDIAVSSYNTGTNVGKVYLLFNDGAIPTTAATADVIINGNSGDTIGRDHIVSGDMNADGKTDLVTSFGGGVYIFYSQNGIIHRNQVTSGEATSDTFGFSLEAGDFNSDGKVDLAVGASAKNTNIGRVYLFYNDGSYPTTGGSADLIIDGAVASGLFGRFMVAGDFNADSRTDLAVGAPGYNSTMGRAYIFYNDGSIPTLASSADVSIDGAATGANFTGNVPIVGRTMAAGDLNADGRTDLIVGSPGVTTNTGSAYVFYNDGTYPSSASTADVTITGETTSNFFGAAVATGDFNADGRIDLTVGAYGNATNTGKIYIFYNDGSIPTTAATADERLTGLATSNFVGAALASGDFNADGKTDLAIGAYGVTTNTGRVYILYNDGSYGTDVGSAEVTIAGQTTSNFFGSSLVSGDFNADGRVDLAVGAYGNTTNTGRTYIFYNDGSIPITAVTADVFVTGEATNNFFGRSLVAGDFDFDTNSDLVVGAYGNTTNTGRIYFYGSAIMPPTSTTTKVKGTGYFRGNVRLR